jgi:hypothetical protein
MAQTSPRHFAFFITPHGYGHASRACAVMNSIRELLPDACFEIFTRVPLWFFNMSLQTGFHYHDVLTDLGLVQSTSMDENLPETIRQLEALQPYRPALVQELARQVRETGCELVVCDVAPLGIAVAREAGVPSVLEENFTWDWIYEGYLASEPRFAPFIAYLHELFTTAGSHIQTEPVCAYSPRADLLTNVVSRKPRTAPTLTRERLGVPKDAPMVLITMGGILTQYPFLERLEKSDEVRFLIPGGTGAIEEGGYKQRGSLVLIPHHSVFYHPDLVEASNAVIGKLGYSTLAEAYAAGLPFAYIPREHFRESPPMARFAREKMGAVELSEERFFSGAWLDLLPDLLARPRQKPNGPNGADQIAEFVLR